MAEFCNVCVHWVTMSELSSELVHFQLLADYNAWMNVKLYQAAASLPAAELAAERGAFFGSLLGTLNHLVAADTIWLGRFARLPAQHSALDPVRAMPAPAGLTAIYSADLAHLTAQRVRLDAIINTWVAQLEQADLDAVLAYQNTKGVAFQRRLSGVLLHFFNHQTHHRGQASTLLSQAGVDIGVTDLLALIPALGPG